MNGQLRILSGENDRRFSAKPKSKFKPKKHTIEFILFDRFGLVGVFNRNKKVPCKNLTPLEISKRKHQAAKNVANKIENSEELKTFLKWIFEVKKAAGIKTNKKFAEELGLKTIRTINNWKRGSGFFPSKRVVQRLLELERRSKIVIIRK